jgi:CBS domain-containing protein
MSIGSVMTVAVVSVEPADSVATAIGRMTEASIGCVAVCEDGVVVGIFTERDVLHLASGGDGFVHRAVGSVMTPRPLTVSPDDDVRSVAELMGRRRIRHLPVVEDGHLLGMVSARDLMAVLLERVWQMHDEGARDTAKALLSRPT